jgi:hypothetical protein
MSETLLLTGATGYVGGRLLRALEDRGHAVRCLARDFGAAAGAAGVSRIVCLGRLAGESRDLSPHLRSGNDVGRLLCESGVPVIELRASIVEIEVLPEGDGSRLSQTAIFDASGTDGLAYWYGIYPLHAVVFDAMLRGVAQAARRPRASIPRRRKQARFAEATDDGWSTEGIARCKQTTSR